MKLTVSPGYRKRLEKLTARPEPLTSEIGLLHSAGLIGIPIMESSLFPFTSACEPCGGTGHGQCRTYCRNCNGGGAIRTVGLLSGEGFGFMPICEPLPLKFQPSFPAGIVPPAALCRGLP